MLSLIEDGAISPSAEDVAARAQVGLRSVFRHFKDMESLYAEMTIQLGRVYMAALAPFESVGWRPQLFEAIDRRVDIYERLLPFKRAADAHRHESPTIQAYHERAVTLLRVRLQVLVPPHLAANPAIFEALDMLLSLDTWARLRFEQKLPADTARHVIDQLVTPLLDQCEPA